ncbi:allantoinase [Sediminibacillus massiliensis]|uniref:allantoinase n=1 Tax=Sediminibacillus massiliensis TaxID=1926277 RepID=UPI00098879E5|nr:allantoinase [Sediminibacillus massiliensis]
MKQLDLIIKNGLVVLPKGVTRQEIGIKDGKIAFVEKSIEASAEEIVNAEGHYVFPGMIDIHVHFNEPGREEWEGFSSGSAMMAAGGCTTYFDMPLNGVPSTTNTDALYQKASIAKQKSIIDFGLWGGLVPGNVQDLSALSDAGVVGFKAFLSASGNEEFEAADDWTLLNGMREIAKLDKVLALHAESLPITEFLMDQKKRNGQTSADDYAEIRPISAEIEAVERALHYAAITGCKLHFVHISSKQAVDRITAAKQQGLDVTVETCPHYLLFNHQALIEKGAIAKCAPPLRSAEDQSRLIDCLLKGYFDIIASDHSPSPFELKDPEKYNLLNAWGGISGGQFSLMALIELALEHGIPLDKVAEWTAANPARRFHLESKGMIKKGYDADLAIVSLAENHRVSADNYFAKHKQTLYMDHSFPCRVIQTYCQGNLVYDEGSVKSGSGNWLQGKAIQLK